jgi:spore coat polysaccharide biosynthesis protein SpsF
MKHGQGTGDISDAQMGEIHAPFAKPTPQEQYWKDNDAYHARSPGDEESNYHLFRKALACADLRWNCSITEYGCGTGANLRALTRCFTSPVLTGVELNDSAALVAHNTVEGGAAIEVGSILNGWKPLDPQDLVLTKGLLIHIHPEDLPRAYKTLVDASDRYVLTCEYYCPTPRMIPYRGHDDRLWARDFAGEIMAAHGLKLVDYGFVSKYDRHPQDDLTWFLMEKP